jgi:hypothetical protein
VLAESTAHVGDVTHMSVRFSLLDNAVVVSFLFPRAVARQCLYTVHSALYTVHCALYTVHCALYTEHCAL